MNKMLGVVLLVAGVILLVFGFNESRSTASDVSRLFNNSPTNRAMWFLVGGGVSVAAGLYLTLKRPRS